jgi:hypothetical protein
LAADLPTVWQAFGAGEVDAEQVRVIDRVVRRVIEAHTLAAIDDQVVVTMPDAECYRWLDDPLDSPPELS